jgi:hypothetical protein
MIHAKRGAPGESTPSTGDGLLGGETIPTIRQSPSRPQAANNLTTTGRPKRTLGEWESLIRVELSHAREHAVSFLERIFNSGRYLIGAKSELPHGQFGSLCERLDLNERHAERLMKIAKNPVLTKPEHAAKLPISMRTLAELATLPAPILEARIIDGTVSIDMERKDAEALKQNKSKTTHGSDIPKPKPAWATEVLDLVAKGEDCLQKAEGIRESHRDCNGAGVSQVSTSPEKRSSGLPTGSDSSKNPVQQAKIAEPETQPNPIIAAWHASTLVQLEEFIEDLGDFITEWSVTVKSREKDAELRYRIWQSCLAIDTDIWHADDESGHWHAEYESIADQLSKLEQAINEAEAEDDEEEDAEEDADLDIPDYLKRGEP